MSQKQRANDYPTAGYFTSQLLRSASPPPPPQAFYQFQAPYRPGNNNEVLPKVDISSHKGAWCQQYHCDKKR